MNAGKYIASPFLQKTAKFYSFSDSAAGNRVLSLCAGTPGLYIGTGENLFLLNGTELSAPLFPENGAVRALCFDGDKLFASSGNEIYSVSGKTCRLVQSFESEVCSMTHDSSGKLWLATEKNLYFLSENRFTPYCGIDGGRTLCIAAYAKNDIIACDEASVKILFGKRPRWTGLNHLNSGLPDCRVNTVASDGWGHIIVGTAEGALLYDGRSFWLSYNDSDSLPRADISVVHIGKNGAQYYGSDVGLYIVDGNKRSFLGFNRFLPSAVVTAVEDGENTVYVGTENGMSVVTYTLTTLAEKAAHMTAETEKYHVRDGFVTNRNGIENNDKSTGSVEISDNDGLWTGSYLISQAYRYAVSGDKQALDIARRCKNAMRELMEVTGIPGFTARAIRREGEEGWHNGDTEWHPGHDSRGELEWKGETSSDEMVGHFSALSAYYDLCADESEKKDIAGALGKIVEHILDNGYTLCDCDGKPTTWAHWGPDDLNLDNKWYWERGINSLEMLSMLKTVFHMTGIKRFEREYEKLISRHHYALNCINYKIDDCYDSHIDDNLGFLITMPLLRYEKDEHIRQYYLMGLRAHWVNERIERCPLWNVLYGALTGDVCDIEAAVRSMQELPIDLMGVPVVNSGRRELKWVEIPEMYGGGKRLAEPLPYDEKPISKYDSNPFAADTRMRYASRAYDGSIFLLPYWIGRYYGLFDE